MTSLRPTLTTLALATVCAFAHATPSTLIWIPSTDIQPDRTGHFGLDNYNLTSDGERAVPTDYGLTFGLLGGRAEIGVDYFAPSDHPVTFNGKYLLCPESGSRPALAVGGYFFGVQSGVTDANVAYLLGSKTFGPVRLTLGYAHGKESTLGGSPDMLLAGLDGVIPGHKKWWWGVDFQSGNSALGALNFGLAYTLSDNVSVIVGYDIYNQAGLDDTITTQFDVNF